MKKHCLCLSIGGTGILFRMASARMRRAIIRRYGGYVRKCIRPALTLDCEFTRAHISGPAEVAVTRPDTSGIMIRRRDFECLWEKKNGHARLHQSIYSFDGLLRIILSVLASENSKVFIHAAGLVYGRNAFIFPGKSSAGKTTISRMAADARILNDEIICADASQRAIRIWATPFWGEMRTGPACAKPFPAHAIMFPRKSRVRTTAQPMPPSQAIPGLLKCCCIFDRSPLSAACALETVSMIVKKVKCFNFEFQKDAVNLRQALSQQ